MGTVSHLVTLKVWPSSLAPELLALSSPFLALQIPPAQPCSSPLCVAVRRAVISMCSVLSSGEPFKDVQVRNTLPMQKFDFCGMLAPSRDKVKICFPDVCWGHHLFWCMNSNWKPALYIYLSACGQYQIKLWSSPKRDLHTVDSIVGQQKLSIVQLSVWFKSLFFSWGSHLRRCVEHKVSEQGSCC